MFAVIVPYRDREHFLEIFLKDVTAYIKNPSLGKWKKSDKNFIVIVSEQKDDFLFNNALSKNIGAVFANQIDKEISHFIFNEVDTIPLKHIDYVTSENIIHFMNFGSCKIIKDDYFRVNGYNPLYNGWGFEDNDFSERLNAFEVPYKKEYLWQAGHVSEKKYRNLEWEYYGYINRKDKWDIKEPTNRNKKMFDFFRSLNRETQRSWASIQGVNLINIEKIKLENKLNNIYFISYNSADYI